jgi:hypothetical protein
VGGHRAFLNRCVARKKGGGSVATTFATPPQEVISADEFLPMEYRYNCWFENEPP